MLWPLSGFAASVALDFVEHDRGSTAYYLLVPAGLPPLIAAYALWTRLPALQRKLPELPAGIVMLGAIALLSLAPMPRYVSEQMERARERAAEREEARQEAAKEAERRRQNLERFQKLTADSPLWDWTPFFGKDSELDAQATAGAKALPHRQADAEEALRRGLGFPLLEYGRLDLTATPALCAAAGDFLQREASAHLAPSADAEYDEKLLPNVEANDIGAIEWLTESCDIDDTVAQIRATIGSYKPTRSRDATLALIAWRRGNGFYQHQRHDIDRAFQEYNVAAELSPGNPQFRKNRGDVYFDMGRYDDAIADYDEAVRFNPGYSEAYYSRGNAFDRKHDDERALASFDDAIRIAPEFAAAHNNRGLVYIRQGKLDLAIQDYDAALNRAPRFRLALDNRGRVRFLQGNYAGAADDFAAALPLKPDEPYTVLLLYLARLHTGQDARGPLGSDAAKLDRDAWPYPVVAAWLGDKDAPTVQADAAASSNPDRMGQNCEAISILATRLSPRATRPARVPCWRRPWPAAPPITWNSPWPRTSWRGCPEPHANIASLIFSAVIRVGKLVLAQGTAGNSEASTTRRPETPRTRP